MRIVSTRSSGMQQSEHQEQSLAAPITPEEIFVMGIPGSVSHRAPYGKITMRPMSVLGLLLLDAHAVMISHHACAGELTNTGLQL